VSLQPPYSLIRPEVETEILPYTLRNNIGVIAYSPMGSGLLSGNMSRERLAAIAPDDWRHRSLHFQEPLFTKNLVMAERLKSIGDRIGKKAGELAIAYVLNHPAVTGAIVGFRNATQVEELVGALEYRLAPEIIAEILA
ncbi:MAG: aldo/keto reductase, partial [Pirellula sp.]